MTINKRFAALPALLAILIILLSGCHGEMRSETVVIPSTEEEHSDDQASKPFQVKTIYRLPVSDTDNAHLLGWTDSESVIGLFQDSGSATRLTQRLQKFSPPYEELEVLHNVVSYPSDIGLSPNGKYIAGFEKSEDSILLKWIELSNGNEKIIASINPSQDLLLTKFTWSENSRYIAYIITDAATGQASKQTHRGIVAGSAVKLAVYDIDVGQVELYSLEGLNISGKVMQLKMSDDGQSVLFAAVQNDGSTSIGLGTINGGRIHIEYEHQDVGDQMAWLNKDQFVFLGKEGTLYEYDRRNKALSILLEKAISFQLSQDRKYIAYSQKDNDSVSIFAGKLQGNNILYKESVYQGFLPTEMYWSLQNESLLINGKKIYSAGRQYPNTAPSPEVSNGQPFIIKFQ